MQAWYIAFFAGAGAMVLLVLYFRSVAAHKATRLVLREQAASVDARLAALVGERDRHLADKIALGKELSAEQARNQHLTERLDRQASELAGMQQTFRSEFENLASKLLEEKSQKFTQQNQLNIGNLLKPLQERIVAFEKKVESAYNQESRERFSLQKELGRMFELNRTLSEQADDLTRALKTDPKKQGNWGEFLLERILESSGLVEGIHFNKQFSVTDGEGMTRRPDVVILLPEDRHVVVDAKVSLTAYERYFSSREPEVAAAALKEHLRSVRQHIEELAPKHYERLFEKSPDFVLMFIPVEPAYGLAMAEDANLFSDAFRKRVILVSVSSLLATLRVIDAMWRLEKQNRNAAEIVRQGSQLYDKFVAFSDHLSSLGRKLAGATAEYEQAMSKLSRGNGNLVRRAEQMRKLGLDTKKQLPETWITGAGGDDLSLADDQPA